MFDAHYGMWGMHWGWWIFGVAFLLIAWLLWRGSAERYVSARKATPLEILQRRYADGEITTEEYEERKARLERDRV